MNAAATEHHAPFIIAGGAAAAAAAAAVVVVEVTVLDGAGWCELAARERERDSSSAGEKQGEREKM